MSKKEEKEEVKLIDGANLNCLYQYYVDLGKLGALRGVFAATKGAVDVMFGSKITFYDVLEGAPELTVEISKEDFTILSEDRYLIQKITEFELQPRGVNPFDYFEFWVGQHAERELARRNSGGQIEIGSRADGGDEEDTPF